MDPAPHLPTATEPTPRKRFGPLLGTAVAIAAIIWGTVVAVDATHVGDRPERTPTGEEVVASLTPTAAEYVAGIMALTPEQLAAGFGRFPIGSSSPTTEEILARLTPDARAYVEGIMALTPQQLAAGFGRFPSVRATPTTGAADNRHPRANDG